MLKTYLYVPQQLNEEINVLAEAQKVSKAELMRNVLKEGIKQMKKRERGSAEILFRIADLGKKYDVRGPKDASVKMDEYLWSKKWEQEK